MKSEQPGQQRHLLIRSESPLINGALLVLLSIGLLQFFVLAREPLRFDDAFMFYRYAANLLAGHGLAWNPEGVPTYGLTSLPWVAFVAAFAATPLPPDVALKTASICAGLASLTLLLFGLRRYWPMSGLAVAWLGAMPSFAYHLFTGMDTMLSMLANSALALAALRYSTARNDPHCIGLLAYAAFAVRPENGLCALGIPLIAWLMQPARNARDLRWLLLLPAILITGQLLLANAYFGTALPLSFFVKSLNSYAGFQNPENPIRYAFDIAPVYLFYLVALGAAATRENMRIWVPFIIPVVLTFAYLATVRQIMGMAGRFYVPFIPFVLVPAVAITARSQFNKDRVAKVFAITLVLGVGGAAAAGRLEARYNAIFVPPPVPEPRFARATFSPRDWWDNNKSFGDDVIARLPAGFTVAASEVGYIGVAGPEIEIIDLVGLNDTEIGRRGFSMGYIIERRPNLIWLPHSDYTGLRAAILADPRFLHRYAYYPDAFNYGLAVRRDPATQRTMASIFHTLKRTRQFDRVVEN
jgi:hypothetical protein